MGNLVFQATLGGQVNLVGPNTASTFNINVPAIAGTMVTTGDTGTVTNTMLAGSIANAKLTNSSVTIGSTSVSLGATSTTLAGLTSVGTNTLTSAAATALTVQSAGTTAITIDTSQNVGIGTSSPADKLDITRSSSSNSNGGLTLTNTDNSGYGSGISWNLKLNSVAGVWGRITTEASSTTATYMPFQTTVGSTLAERMRIDSSGNLLVGTTSNYIYNGNKLVVKQSSSANTGSAAALATTYAGDVSNHAVYISKFDNNSTTSQKLVGFFINDGNSGQGQINANGANAAAFGSFSDVRLKENIVDLPSQLANICALRPVEFDYKTGGHQIGFIAQEIQNVYPDSVGEDGGENNYLTLTGWSKTEARLVKAIQELKAIVDTQATEIAELKAKVA